MKREAEIRNKIMKYDKETEGKVGSVPHILPDKMSNDHTQCKHLVSLSKMKELKN